MRLEPNQVSAISGRGGGLSARGFEGGRGAVRGRAWAAACCAGVAPCGLGGGCWAAVGAGRCGSDGAGFMLAGILPAMMSCGRRRGLQWGGCCCLLYRHNARWRRIQANLGPERQSVRAPLRLEAGCGLRGRASPRLPAAMRLGIAPQGRGIRHLRPHLTALVRALEPRMRVVLFLRRRFSCDFALLLLRLHLLLPRPMHSVRVLDQNHAATGNLPAEAGGVSARALCSQNGKCSPKRTSDAALGTRNGAR